MPWSERRRWHRPRRSLLAKPLEQRKQIRLKIMRRQNLKWNLWLAALQMDARTRAAQTSPTP